MESPSRSLDQHGKSDGKIKTNPPATMGVPLGLVVDNTTCTVLAMCGLDGLDWGLAAFKFSKNVMSLDGNWPLICKVRSNNRG